jgi:hypothetical protein
VISAITATAVCASAVANNAWAIPQGRKRAMRALMIPTASTPKYIRLAGSPSLPIRPTPRLSQTRMHAANERVIPDGGC